MAMAFRVRRYEMASKSMVGGSRVFEDEIEESIAPFYLRPIAPKLSNDVQLHIRFPVHAPRCCTYSSAKAAPNRSEDSQVLLLKAIFLVYELRFRLTGPYNVEAFMSCRGA